MSLRGLAFTDLMRPYYEHALEGLPELDWFDAHAHIGHHDPDGLEADPPDLLEAMDVAGHRRALVFSLHEPGGEYSAANDISLQAGRDHDGRFVILGRVDPKVPGALQEARRCMDNGAAGIKLHPRSDSFTLPNPVVDQIVAMVAEYDGIVLFHAGRGIPNLGLQALELADANPATKIILAHAGVSDLGVVWRHVSEVGNLYFDTAWWQVSDMLALYSQVPPSRILWATDMPYGTPMLGGWANLRLLKAFGMSDEAVVSIVGGQLGRLVAHEEPLDLGPPPSLDVLGPRAIAAERAAAYITGAFMGIVSGGGPIEAIAMARLACQCPDTDDPLHVPLSHIDALLSLAQAIYAADPENPRAALVPAILAQTIAGTPWVELPDLALGEAATAA